MEVSLNINILVLSSDSMLLNDGTPAGKRIQASSIYLTLRTVMMDRRVLAAAVLLGLFALAAPRVGEGNRSQARAISSIRAIVSAELAYASANGCKYGILECLTDPPCHPLSGNYSRLLEPSVAATPDRDGYHFEFHPHPDSGPERSSGFALTSFAVIAVPTDAGMPRDRAFCGDDRQAIYVTDGRVTPRVERGRCIDTSKTLR